MATKKTTTDKTDKPAAKKTAAKKTVAKKKETKPAAKAKTTKTTSKKTTAAKATAKKTTTKKATTPKPAAPKVEEAPKKGFFSSLIEDVKENIAEGTKVLAEKSSEVLEVVKEKSSGAIKAGSEAIENVNEKVHDFAERQKLQKLRKEHEERRAELVMAFGEVVLNEYLANGSVPKRFLTKKSVDAIVEEIRELDREMNIIDQKLSD
ncbi:MAG: hypothetical protein D6714_05415 [Bacteroidetes bacterium]|nr:MAG: hypothetical protein D6714_05415 [Bacteroidota bacterium]